MDAEKPIYVVVCKNDPPTDPAGPLVFEQYTNNATLQAIQERAARMEKRYGACRIARLVFEDHPAFNKGA